MLHFFAFTGTCLQFGILTGGLSFRVKLVHTSKYVQEGQMLSWREVYTGCAKTAQEDSILMTQRDNLHGHRYVVVLALVYFCILVCMLKT